MLLEGTSADLGVDTHQRYDNAGDMGSVELIKFSAYDHDLYICFVCDDWRLTHYSCKISFSCVFAINIVRSELGVWYRVSINNLPYKNMDQTAACFWFTIQSCLIWKEMIFHSFYVLAFFHKYIQKNSQKPTNNGNFEYQTIWRKMMMNYEKLWLLGYYIMQ